MWRRIQCGRAWRSARRTTAGPGAAVHLGYGGADPSGVLDLGFWERAGAAGTWREMHASRDGEHQLNLLRRCTYAGRPFGDEDFVVRLEEHFQRTWRRWSFEKASSNSA